MYKCKCDSIVKQCTSTSVFLIHSHTLTFAEKNTPLRQCNYLEQQSERGNCVVVSMATWQEEIESERSTLEF